ncbi:uncharacterized protein LOC100901375 [Galendromus occidentalis]|uniref:Uncharacterized protein LOC100901375 n=1 Tax=Galendromus occidentalis TaxID=34638 RepID=A0AAJ7SG07_9ACAR|nr:uncharacterized protein LOC100901375 [Galendromus occidentalis]
MPKSSLRSKSRLDVLVKLFGDETFSTDGTVLLCKVCEKAVNEIHHESSPASKTLRKTYLKKVYGATINRIRDSIGDSRIWVSMDETTDLKGQFVVNTIVGRMDASEPTKPYLLSSEVVDRTNHATIAQAICNAMSLLWPNGVVHDRVILFVTDGAKYMKKAAGGLQIMFPKMVYITCVVHGVHRVCEEMRKLFPEVDSFVANAKKVFLKAPSRIQRFKEMAPDLALPPQPVVTRWGTWLDATCYYADHYERIEAVLQTFGDDEAVSISKCSDLLSSPRLKQQLIFLSSNYRTIQEAIRKLECTQQSMETTFGILDGIKACIQAAAGPKAVQIKEKLDMVIRKNEGHRILQVSYLLRGEGDLASLNNLTVADLTSFRYAPLTSVDVERSFSR